MCAKFTELYYRITAHFRCKVNFWHAECIDEAIDGGTFGFGSIYDVFFINDYIMKPS